MRGATRETADIGVLTLGRAFEYYQALEEVKARFAESRGGGAAHEEVLRKASLPQHCQMHLIHHYYIALYTPGQQGQAASSSSAATAAQAFPQAPTREDVEAANTARAAEIVENDQAAQQAGGELGSDGLPPSYDIASRPRQ